MFSDHFNIHNLQEHFANTYHAVGVGGLDSVDSLLSYTGAGTG